MKSNGNTSTAPHLFSAPDAPNFPEGTLFALIKYSSPPSSTRRSNRSAVFLPGRCPPTVCPVGSSGRAGPPAGRPVQSHPAAVVGRRRAELLHPGPGVPAERLGSLVSPPMSSVPLPFCPSIRCPRGPNLCRNSGGGRAEVRGGFTEEKKSLRLLSAAAGSSRAAFG